MFSPQSDFQMPRTIPNYQLHQQNPFQQQIQVFQQHFQAFQQQQQQQQHHQQQQHQHLQHPQQFQLQPQQLIPHNLNPTPSPSLSASPPRSRPQSQSPPHRHGSSSSNRRASRGRTKRVRTIFTQDQLKRLEQEFSVQMYLVGHDRGHLAKSLGLTEAQVKVWFQNRRIKFRKLSSDSASLAVTNQPIINNNHVTV